MIVDTETHPLRYAHPSLTNPEWSMVKRYTWHEQPPEFLIALMDWAGVDRAFLISYDAEDLLWHLEAKGMSVEDYAGGRKYALQGLRKFPDRFWWFNTVKNPRQRDAAALVRADFAAGAAGIKLFPAYIRSRLTDPGLLRVFDTVREARGRALVSFQTLRPPESPALEEYLQEMATILERYPEVPFALMQAGCADPLTSQADRVTELVRCYPNVFLSTGYVGEVWDDETEYPFERYQRRIESLVRSVGAERLMWGTDWPWCEDRFLYKQGVDCIRRHASYMSDEEKAMFLGGTAARFMGVA